MLGIASRAGGGQAELPLRERAEAVMLEDRLAVGERLAGGGQPVGAALDQVEHGLGEAAAAAADGAALARQVGGERAEIEDGLSVP